MPDARITQFLLLALSSTTPAGERLNALRAIDRHLANTGIDSHQLVERLSNEPVSPEDLQRVFDAGYAKREQDEIDGRNRAMAVTSKPVVDIGDADGINGYSWREIAGHCALNASPFFSDFEKEFIPDVAERFARIPHYQLSEKQKMVLARVFRSWFNGKI